MLVTETVMEHLATSIGVNAFKLRTDNMYKVSLIDRLGNRLL